MKILVFGSTYLSEIVCTHLLKDASFELVGYVPSQKRITVPGKMPIPIASEDAECDLILSIQYDKIIKNTKKSFNVHTGLLPEYGGVDILYHTLKNKALEQGITFHKITKNVDAGPIVSKISYPVFPDDTIKDLYLRLCAICPEFVSASLRLLKTIDLDNLNQCYAKEPTIYKTGQVDEKDKVTYNKIGLNLKKISSH